MAPLRAGDKRGLNARVWPALLLVLAAGVVGLVAGVPTTDDDPPAVDTSVSGATTEAEVKSGSEELTITAEDIDLNLEGTFELPGPAVGMTFDSRRTGFLAVADGKILRFTLRGSRLSLRSVAELTGQPRDVAYGRGKLFVTEATYPCREKSESLGLVRCRAAEFPDLSPQDANVEVLRRSRGRVYSFDVAADGTLSGQKILLDEIPVATSDHAVNGITIGKDGYVYFAVGNVGHTLDPETIRGLSVSKELLGTIVRMRPDGTQMGVFARGLRNLYHLTTDEQGQLYGVDNDGPTRGGWRFEEVILFQPGANYGYPAEGTYGDHRVRTAQPMWVLGQKGSAGIEWAGRVGLPAGLLIGSCNSLTYLRIDPRKHVLGRPEDEVVLAEYRSTCVPIVTASPDGRLFVGTLNPNELSVYRIALRPAD